jgi:hypothetical protein
MPLYGGIDLHANNSVVVLLNEQDQVIYQRRLANHLPTILGQLAPYHMDITGVVVESNTTTVAGAGFINSNTNLLQVYSIDPNGTLWVLHQTGWDTTSNQWC